MSWIHALGFASMALVGGLSFASCHPETNPAPEDHRAAVWKAGPPLPAPVTNNAVAAVETPEGTAVLSFLGLDSTKVWSGVTNAAYRWDLGNEAWREIDPVPGPGRLASTAQVVDGRIYVIGGYTVAEDGSERSVPDVNVYDPSADRWSRAADIPTPTDDAVAGVWRERRIVLVSGWHDDGNVPHVQIFDPASNRWTQSTPIPGTPVFGHAGAVTGDRVVYVDGTAVVDGRPRFAIEESTWMGRLDPDDPSSLLWTRQAQHPGPPLYRAAGGTVRVMASGSVGDPEAAPGQDERSLALFVGGSDNPYNYDGVGYDGVPSRPVRQVLALDPATSEWLHLVPPPVASMDHRNVGVADGYVFLVGGMHEDQVVTADVWYARADELLAGSF